MKQSLLDKAITSIAPVTGAKRLYARAKIEAYTNVNSYSPTMERKEVRNHRPIYGSNPNENVSFNLAEGRDFSRNMYEENPIARGIIETYTTSVVGSGLQLESRIESSLVNMSPESVEKLQDTIEKRWRLWANSTDCDVYGRHTFNQLQQQAFRLALIDGDMFASLPIAKNNELKVMNIEARMVRNPFGMADSLSIAGGVEVEKGVPVAYHVFQPSSINSEVGTTKRFDRYGKKSGRLNMLHVLVNDNRPGQFRGIPLTAPIHAKLKQIDRFTEAEIAAAVVEALFGVFIENDGAGVTDTFGETMDAVGSAIVTDVDGNIVTSAESPSFSLGNGTVMALGPGEKVTSMAPNRPSSHFEPFLLSIIKQIGMAMNIPFEVLLKHFSASFSASRAALQDAWRTFIVFRNLFAQQYTQMVFESWLEIEVLTGRIPIVNFMDPLQKKAFSQANWHGPVPISIDPLKEANGSEKLLNLKLTTHEREARKHTGVDWANDYERLVSENKLIAEKEGVTGENAM